MPNKGKIHKFTALLREPKNPQNSDLWGFVLVPSEVSETFPRRGRLGAELRVKKAKSQIMLEPDGKLGHWARVDSALINKANLSFGQELEVSLELPSEEPPPPVPNDFSEMLETHPDALATWNATTPLAQVDWIHWVESAKQTTTRKKRISDAADMLSGGKKRVCCFDPSGYYSKSLSAPKEAKD